MGTSLDLEVLIWCSWNSLMIYVFRMWAFGQAAASTIDYMIDSVAAAHPSDPYLSTAKIDDRLVVVGNPDKPLSINALSLINAQPDVGGSGIGGIKETQKMVDFCGKHNITCMIEKIPMSYLNTAME
ncbi:unnamed protein product [Sphagnum jensenii]|uniref:Uncharacterized protein n=1 Tax=Sphagnum jensenii TaxID=128206 RepID=A0ABP0WVW6_9BRYO